MGGKTLWPWALGLLLSACTLLQNPRPQAVLSTDPLVYVPEAQVEERRTAEGVERVRFRTEERRSLGEVWEDLQAGFRASRIQTKCAELLGFPAGGGPYLLFRLPQSRERDLSVRITPLDGHWLSGHTLFLAELRRPPARLTFLGCPLD